MVIFNSYVKLPEGNESVWKSFVQPMFSMFFGFQKLIQQKWPVSPIPHFAAGSFIHMACALNCTSEKTQQLRMLMITVKQDSVSHFSYWYRIGNHDATDDHYHSFNISYIYMIIYVWYMYEKIQLQFPLVTGFLPRCHQGSLCVPRRFPGWTRHSPPVKNGYS